MDRVEMLATYFGISTAELFIDPYSKPKPLANPAMMAKLLENSPPLYDLFTLVISLQEKDLEIRYHGLTLLVSILTVPGLCHVL